MIAAEPSCEDPVVVAVNVPADRACGCPLERPAREPALRRQLPRINRWTPRCRGHLPGRLDANQVERRRHDRGRPHRPLESRARQVTAKSGDANRGEFHMPARLVPVSSRRPHSAAGAARQPYVASGIRDASAHRRGSLAHSGDLSMPSTPTRARVVSQPGPPIGGCPDDETSAASPDHCRSRLAGRAPGAPAPPVPTAAARPLASPVPGPEPRTGTVHRVIAVQPSHHGCHRWPCRTPRRARTMDPARRDPGRAVRYGRCRGIRRARRRRFAWPHPECRNDQTFPEPPSSSAFGSTRPDRLRLPRASAASRLHAGSLFSM